MRYSFDRLRKGLTVNPMGISRCHVGLLRGKQSTVKNQTTENSTIDAAVASIRAPFQSTFPTMVVSISIPKQWLILGAVMLISIRSVNCVDCSAGEVICNGNCTKLEIDPHHCGMCLLVCPDANACCMGACTNLQSNTLHCGACGMVCRPLEICDRGDCRGQAARQLSDLAMSVCVGSH